MPYCYSTVSNMRRYGQQWQNGILLFYCIFLSPLHRYLSLHRLYLISSLFVTFYLFPLLLAQESCLRSLSRKLSPISLPYLPILTANLASPHRWSRRLMLWFWLIWWVLGLWLGFDLGWGCGWWCCGSVCVCGCGEWQLVAMGFWWGWWLAVSVVVRMGFGCFCLETEKYTEKEREEEMRLIIKKN